MLICTWFYAEPKGEESTYYQVSGSSSSEQFQATYWRCVAAFFASSRRNNPHERHLLFSNLPRAPIIDGFDVQALLDRLGVEHVELPYTYKPPEGYYGAWRNQFYIFDIISHLKEQAVAESCIVLDSDCVWIDSVTAVEAALEKSGVLTYTIDYPADFPGNGLSRFDMQQLFGDMLGRALPSAPVYCGGEIFAASTEALNCLEAEIAPLWRSQLERHARGQSKCNEEAQALTYLYYKLGYALGTANPFIKRIWTGLPFSYRTDLKQDYGLVIWHLPTEKRWGFRRLFDQVTNEESEFWRIPVGLSFAKYLGHFLGVGHRSSMKTARDVGESLNRKLLKVIARL